MLWRGPKRGRSQSHGRRGAGGILLLGGSALAIVGALLHRGLAAVLRLPDGAGDAYTLVLLRHGESQWNLENRFTGWVDVDVTDVGVAEAKHAGELMRDANVSVDVAYTSVQKRAIKTLALALEEMDRLWIPVHKTWKLNERMYGDLQGKNKADAAAKFGEEQVTQWRRSFAVPPPVITEDNEFHPKLDPKYAQVPKRELPLAESLKLTIDRVLPYWKSTIVPSLKSGNKVLIAAHGNSLRALVKYLDNIPEDKIVGLNIPTGVPLVYKLDRRFRPIQMPDHADGLNGAYLGDKQWVDQKINGVKNQAKR